MRKTILIIFLLFPSLSLTARILTTHFQDSAPKYFLEDGIVRGICTDIIISLNKELRSSNIQILTEKSSYPFVPFRRLQEDLENGIIDIFIGLAKSPSRVEKYVFLETPVYQVSSTFAKKILSDFEYDSQSDLVNQSIGVVSGSKTADQLNSIGTLNVLNIKTLDQALRMLNLGRIDLVFYHSLGLKHTIAKLELESTITCSDKAFENYNHYIAFNKSISPVIMEQVEKALQRLIDVGGIDKILSNY
ncbi:MAG: transporter substrate-binding domain-containing protein [Spirochaetaceae bacterium]|nr:transporter substrate-binding domain-containing protein [Spirochaetaceae bacterium]